MGTTTHTGPSTGPNPVRAQTPPPLAAAPVIAVDLVAVGTVEGRDRALHRHARAAGLYCQLILPPPAASQGRIHVWLAASASRFTVEHRVCALAPQQGSPPCSPPYPPPYPPPCSPPHSPPDPPRHSPPYPPSCSPPSPPPYSVFMLRLMRGSNRGPLTRRWPRCLSPSVASRVVSVAFSDTQTRGTSSTPRLGFRISV
eukprot:CAMPEP_0181185130 /NCGR_PEP_ID=MMETSP1096-20121128/9340_1 /TAXON_ID=156174 ORGANISM="Chrysochromulina ericina, Strain CCMP281" /NCGR_SAMPLE_ID=MMETSP1096 /ASSEMBLY_ACC=CAM_ASM_000453 /LENGTH=198 /DNA_ID=CAMNT_0023273947 /DNA_START=236 /DNA_END=832 /DNA_ORIENTATION=-